MPVHAKRLIRKMRGGAQAHLLECDDGHYYVVKFRNNPQHRRILVNEWIASVFLNYLRISMPETAIVNLPADFLAGNSDRDIREIPPRCWFMISFPIRCWTRSPTGTSFWACWRSTNGSQMPMRGSPFSSGRACCSGRRHRAASPQGWGSS